MKNFTLSDIDRDLNSEDKCIDFLERLRWPNGVTCVKCDKKHISRIETVARGRSKNTIGTEWKRRLYECLECGEQFSVKSGTLFHDSHLPLQKWFRAIVLVCEAKKGRSANETARLIGVTVKTGWFLCHRIREAMKTNGGGLFGYVEADEKYLGGAQKGKGVWYGKNTKQTIIGLKQREGEIRLVHAPDAKAKTIRAIAKEHLTDDVEIIMTDEFVAYPFAFRGTHLEKKHQTVSHKRGEYVRGIISTNTVESAFSLLQRGLVGSFHQLSAKHLFRYLHEFEWRHNNRKNPQMFADVLRNIASQKPLTFRALTSEDQA